MYSLSTREVIGLVKANFDELEQNSSDMAELEDVDDAMFGETIVRILPDAINTVHASAPVQLLDGMELGDSGVDGATIEDGVLTIKVGRPHPFLRLVAFKSAEERSPIVCETVPEYSAAGRMQLNPYSRGTIESPRLVLSQGKAEDGSTVLKYYSLGEEFEVAGDAIDRFEYIERYEYGERASADSFYDVAESVVANVIDQVTGMLLAIYGASEKASYFLGRASFS